MASCSNRDAVIEPEGHEEEEEEEEQFVAVILMTNDGGCGGCGGVHRRLPLAVAEYDGTGER